MESCWISNPTSRPSFNEVCDILEEMGKNAYVNFDISSKTVLPPAHHENDTQSVNSEYNVHF